MAFRSILQLQFDNEIYWEKKNEITLLHFSVKLIEIRYIT